MLVLNVTGNLGADAEVKDFNGRTYASFRIASTSKRKGNPVTTWVSVLSAYSENLMPYLKKGQSVFVSGEAEIKTYSTRDGGTGVDVSMFASSLALTGAPLRANDNGGGNLPTQQATTQPSAKNGQINDQELPF